MHLKVHAPDGRVTVSAPISVRAKVVESFAAGRVEWIRRQQDRVRRRLSEARRRFVTGETHSLWGVPRRLVVVEHEGRQGVSLDDQQLTLFCHAGSDTTRRAAVMHRWHRSVLQETLPPLIHAWEQRLNVHVKEYYLRRMKTRWGTCNYRTRQVRLNTELVTKAHHLLEYVLVHEMVHLIVPNHGPRFVALMNEHYSSWREARRELNASGVEVPEAAHAWPLDSPTSLPSSLSGNLSSP